MRTINLVIVHCSASDSSVQDSLEAVKEFHIAPQSKTIHWGKYTAKGRAFSDIGYHWLITKDGKIHKGRPEKQIGAHCRGFNEHSIGVCLTGDNDFSSAQFESLRTIKKELKERYGLSDLDFVGHSSLNKEKTCPNFDLTSVLCGMK